MIGQYLDQLDEIGAALGAPVIKGDTPVKERERLFPAFRAGEERLLVVSKVANFSVDLPVGRGRDPGVAGRSARGRRRRSGSAGCCAPRRTAQLARFYTLVTRDTVDAEFAQHRQRFLAEQGYAYAITDAADV